MARPLHVLVVDRSPQTAQLLQSALGGSGLTIEARGPQGIDPNALLRNPRPDLLVLDLESSPNGLELLRSLTRLSAMPVLLTAHDSSVPHVQLLLRGLEEGAVGLLPAGTLELECSLPEGRDRLAELLREAASAQPDRHALFAKNLGGAGSKQGAASADKVLAIGASAGSTLAIEQILSELPPESTGVLVVQHMPAAIAATWVRRLDSQTRFEVREARHGDHLFRGRALVAPGDRHLLLRRDGSLYSVAITETEPVGGNRPSVDLMFRSVAAAAGSRAVGVILSGMGDDGAAGMLELRAAGAATLAQDEATSVVFGMPREAIARGGVQEVVPLPRLPQAILTALLAR